MRVVVKDQGNMVFEAQTEKGSFTINAPQISPLEYFLGGLITCSATDMIVMPKKQGYEVENLEICGDVIRNETMPRKFNKLHLSYTFDSLAQDDLAIKWVMASLETYCSTVNTIRDSVKISYSVTHNGREIADHKELISGGGSNLNIGDIGGCPA